MSFQKDFNLSKKNYEERGKRASSFHGYPGQTRELDEVLCSQYETITSNRSNQGINELF